LLDESVDGVSVEKGTLDGIISEDSIEGKKDGALDGESVGVLDGLSEGLLEGDRVAIGAKDGMIDETIVGKVVGFFDGDVEGLDVGTKVGSNDGEFDGSAEGPMCHLSFRHLIQSSLYLLLANPLTIHRMHHLICRLMHQFFPLN
jgi:hypothetical protein